MSLKTVEMNLTVEEIWAGIKQVFPDGSEELFLVNPRLASIYNGKGYASITFHNAEFTLHTRNFFLADHRIFSLNDVVYQFMVPREKENQIELFIGGWVQPNISPRIISDFLAQVPNFPKVISVKEQGGTTLSIVLSQWKLNPQTPSWQ